VVPGFVRCNQFTGAVGVNGGNLDLDFQGIEARSDRFVVSLQKTANTLG
jgi:hypothetical protein